MKILIDVERGLETGVIQIVDATKEEFVATLCTGSPVQDTVFGAKPARRRTTRPPGIGSAEAILKSLDTEENRQGIEDANEILKPPRGYGINASNLGLFHRLRGLGYERRDWRAVLTCLATSNGGMASWCVSKGKTELTFILRPDTFEKILAESGKAEIEAVKTATGWTAEEAEAALRKRADELPF